MKLLNRIRYKKRIALIVVVLLLLAASVPWIVVAVSKMFTAQESAVRTDWTIETGELLGVNEEFGVEYAEAELGDGLRALQLIPQDIGDEGFTYYDTGVQARIEGALEQLKGDGAFEWSATMPLAVLNPYGTGSNGLYLYFETDHATSVSYTIRAEGYPDLTATAADVSGSAYCREHEFQLIGLIPGETNQVTMTLTGSWGNARQIVTFRVDMPETQSGYDVALETTDGDSEAQQADGLFAMMRVNGHLGYGFFYDDSGVLRYEMVLEGYGPDRILFDGNEIITCVSSTKLARINGLGQVTQVYELDGYELHHDIGFGADGELLALAEDVDGETVEDLVLSIDAESGDVSLLVDFAQLMEPYFETTRPVTASDDFFWQADEWDWLHVNSVLYRAEDDSLIVSSRETSTVIKLTGVHGVAEVDWLAGDARFWEDTAYADKCLAQTGDFVPQYGQHCVEWFGEVSDGVYELAMFNNNYWSLNSRDFELDVADSVGTDLYGSGSETSQLYIYRIDENARTFSLVDSFDVPYSSIVSNASLCGKSGNWVVNSGVAMVFGEYDADGKLIREYAYECTMQNYRTFKYEMTNLWFA